MDKKLWVIMLCIGVTAGFGLSGCSGSEEQINALKAIDPQQVTLFRIYPRTSEAYRTPITFTSSDPLVGGFFNALTDLLPSTGFRGGMIASPDHCWFLEMSVTGFQEMIQIKFHIPSQQQNIVIGGIGEFTETGGRYLGGFQSELLFQWYQKYSHRWLHPEPQQGSTN